MKKLHYFLLLFIFLSLQGCEEEVCAFIDGSDGCYDDEYTYTPPPDTLTSQAHVGIDGNSNALFMWTYQSGLDSTWKVGAKLYTTNSEWATIASNDIDAASCDGSPENVYPELVMESSGTAISLWQQSGQILAHHYTPSTGWNSAVTLDTGASCHSYDVIMNDNGEAFAYWKSSNSLLAAHYIPIVGWSAIETVEASFPDFTDKTINQADINDNHDIALVWSELNSSSGRYDILLNRYDPTTGWSGSEIVESNLQLDPFPQVAMDETGNIIVAWNGGSSIWARRYNKTTGWSDRKDIRLETNITSSTQPQLAMNAGGNAVLVWTEAGEVWSSVYHPANGWTAPQNIKPNDPILSYYAVDPRVAIDTNGRASAVWWDSSYFQGRLSRRIRTSSYHPGSEFSPPGWGGAYTLGYGYSPQLAMDKNGDAVVIWQYITDETDTISSYHSRYNIRGSGWDSLKIAASD